MVLSARVLQTIKKAEKPCLDTVPILRRLRSVLIRIGVAAFSACTLSSFSDLEAGAVDDCRVQRPAPYRYLSYRPRASP